MIVVQLLHDFHLTLDKLYSVRFHEFGFFVDLDSDLLVQRPMQSQANDCISTLPDTLANEIVV